MFAIYTFFQPVKYLLLKKNFCSNDLNDWHNEITYKNIGFIEKSNYFI